MGGIPSENSKPGDVVLDCFGGCCKVADICKELGRRYIVIEQDEKYVTEANKRLEQVLSRTVEENVKKKVKSLDKWF